jgi:protein-L-isoaspartate O-methyltransferase
MQQKFDQIKKRYEEFHRELLKSGKLTFRETEKGYWGISVLDDVFKLFNKIELHKYKNLIDIGSGDGRVALIASLFTNATGIEFDKELHDCAIKLMNDLNLKTALLNKDFLEENLSKYDIIYTFPDKPIPRDIEQKLLKELKGKLIVYGPHFHPEQLNKQETLEINGTKICIYEK